MLEIFEDLILKNYSFSVVSTNRSFYICAIHFNNIL